MASETPYTNKSNQASAPQEEALGEAAIDRCPECGSTEISRNYDRGEVTCMNCGLVINERIIDHGAEWRAFTPEEKEKRSRVGSPMTPTVHDKGLSTVIDWRDKDAMGKRLEPRKRIEVLRWRKWQIRTRVHSSIDRNLAQAMSELDRISSQVTLPRTVKEAAALIYRRAVERGLVRGRSIESVMAASIYAACRIHKIPRTLDEIALVTKSGRKDVARCYRLLLREIDLNIPIADPLDFIPRIGRALQLGGETQRRGADIVKQARKLGITAGKDPAGLAAAGVYIACLLEDERRTQKEIAQAAQVTEVTVRNRYKELVAKLKIELPAV
jgi:transcription initiation factor TFIIB